MRVSRKNCKAYISGQKGHIMEQLILHLIGDYVTQSDWMAQNKTKSIWAAFVHASAYSIPFIYIDFLGRESPNSISLTAWLVIWATHLLIDRFRLAKYLVFAKNFLGWPWPKWEDCKSTGYPSATPPWMSVWLMIAADNTLHLAINYGALRWL